MHLLDYINMYEDWEERLTNPPYNLIVKTSYPYKLLKYSQIDSDFSYTEVQEARGCIVRKDFDEEWIYVCRPFVKFFNWGEPYAARLDWREVTVTEKIDGSLMKLWYDRGKWRLSTNGTIDAFEASIDGTDTTYGDLFMDIVGELYPGGMGRHWNLYPECTYLFELVSPETRVVLSYPKEVYYLTCFDNEDGSEIGLTSFMREEMVKHRVKFPYVYDKTSLDEIVEWAKTCTNLEGVVVRDCKGNRIKVKTPRYLEMAHSFTKGKIGKLDLLRMTKEETLDDFLGYFPEYGLMAYQVYSEVNQFIVSLLIDWKMYGTLSPRREFALKIKNQTNAPLLFMMYTNPQIDIEHYVWHELDYKKLAHMLGYEKEN